LSAGFARTYDGTDLAAQPLVVLRPLGASLVSSLLLFAICWMAGLLSGPAYPSFLSLFWMTAPLAWLYAIPVERFLGPLESMRANYLLLGAVATWRVLLMARVIAVLSGRGWFAPFFVVMLFADAVVVVISVLGLLFRPGLEEWLAAGMAGVASYVTPE